MPIYQGDQPAQVQDLEKQLAQAKAQIQYLKSISRNSSADSTSGDVNLNIPELGADPPKRTPPPANANLSSTRSVLRDLCRGVYKPPPPYRLNGKQKDFSPPMPELPPRAVADHLLTQFNATVHNVVPILHWPTFVSACESLYQHGDLTKVEPSWLSTFFAVLSCGLLFTVDKSILAMYPDRGKDFSVISRVLTDLFNDEFVIDHVRAALLMAVYLTEINCKSAAWTWLGSTIRIAQDIGLHRESGPWPVIEGEMRRRVWWGVYVWDRLLSIEMGRPLMIVDADCDVGLPCPVDDHFIYDEGFMVPNGAPEPANYLLTTIHIVRMVPALLKTLQSPSLSPQTLAAFDNHFTACLNTFPAHCQLHSSQPLDARSLSPIIYLQTARLVLHRHNLSPAQPPDASLAIGDARVINDRTGRYIHGFLKILGEKIFQSGRDSVERDEGLLAIVSADAQGSTDSSWIWAGSETGAALNSPMEQEREREAQRQPIPQADSEEKLDDWVLTYFFNSPFFDRSSNNASLYMQAQTNFSLQHLIHNRAQFEGRLKTMVGMEFIVAAEDPANSVWVIKKQMRRSPVEVQVLDVYFVIGENIYMAPTIHGVMTSRLLSATSAISKAQELSASLTHFSPESGYTYLPPQPSQPSQPGSTTTSFSQSSSAPTTVTAQSSVPPPPPSTLSNVPPSSVDVTIARESHNMQSSLNASLRFTSAPGGYLDDNPITDPQQLMMGSSQSQGHSQSQSSLSKERAAAKEALPSVSTAAAAAAAAAARDKGKTVSPTSPNSKKRRKSKATGMGAP
ncbi:Mediator of RNA polymerase II transcription subunit [Drechslerella dactyloides]|uniref:Mediator of RNA polymerase II transcription subunit 6 n=1 Tax=Drechslerella dactyloides TaxID=74499 RepID=A0AAD6J727_DREDA|nr:Mediator of RNA polymerase II transcription subunit [Drechslerella dactyloides]